MGRIEYWVKIKDEFMGYSWDYFVYEKSTASAALEDKLTWLRGKRTKLLGVIMLRNIWDH
jgi:hypothetical protein